MMQADGILIEIKENDSVGVPRKKNCSFTVSHVSHCWPFVPAVANDDI